MKAPLLYLVHRMPYPPNKGDKVRSFNILRQLSQRYDVHLGTFVDDANDLDHVSELAQWTASHHVERLHPRWAKLGSVSAFASNEALSLAYYRSRRMRRWVNETVVRHAVRKAAVFSSPVAQYLYEHRWQRSVVDFCDMDSAKWTQYAQRRGFPSNQIFRREGRKLLEFERHVARHADASFFVTQAEADLFSAAAPESAERVHVAQNGVRCDYFAPEHAGTSPYAAGKRVIVFSGAMDYWPNVDAACWFAKEILPRLRANDATINFCIVGMNPVAEVKALAQLAGVQVTGRVDDVRPYVAHADVVVAPLRIARGIQNKVLEAMAMARPVVAHAACLQGMSAKGGDEILSAQSVDDFVMAVTAVLQGHYPLLGTQARQHVVAHYNWDSSLAPILAALD